MNVEYKFREKNGIMELMLMTTDLGLYNINKQAHFAVSDLKSVGNFIDKLTFAGKWCYVLLKEFQKEINTQLVISSQLITDKELSDSIINYGKGILSSEIEIMSPELFGKMVKDVEEFIEKYFNNEDTITKTV